MVESLVVRARGGDADAFSAIVEPYRGELLVHCYRILGSIQDAEDALQETLLAAWRGLGAFEGRSSIRTWFYKIATNTCLNARRAGERRHTVVTGGLRAEPPAPTRLTEVAWLQPCPDPVLGLADPAPGPERMYEEREAISLAFVTALQLLPARQRAVLVLRDVLGYRAAEVAQLLDVTEESVTSALKRARATLADRYDRPEPPPAPGSAAERALVDRFVTAFGAHDVPAIVDLLTHDAWVKMPPMPFEYQGREAAARFFIAMTPPGGRHLRFVHTRANGQPACAAYVREGTTETWHAIGLLVLTLAGGAISELIRFDTSVLPSFGLPRVLHGPAPTT